MDAQPLIYSAANYNILLVLPTGKSFPFATTDNVSYNTVIGSEPQYAVGSENPIGIGRNERKHSGKMSLQAGEIAAILLVLGISDMTLITGCILTISAKVGVFAKTFMNVVLNSEGLDIKTKDKATLISLDWEAAGVV
jgi:hypothetical protein